MELLHLPDLVLIRILQYVGIEDTVVNVARVCQYLHKFISTTSQVWTHFSLENRTSPVSFTTEDQISAIFKHAVAFHCFDVPGINPIYSLEASFDRCLNDGLVHSTNLTWLDLSSSPVVHLDFLEGCSKLDTLILGECYQILPESFHKIAKLEKLFYIDAGFTSLTGETLADSVPGSVFHIEVCGVVINLKQLETILEKCTKLESIRFQLPDDVNQKDFIDFTSKYNGICFGLHPTKFPYYAY